MHLYFDHGVLQAFLCGNITHTNYGPSNSYYYSLHLIFRLEKDTVDRRVNLLREEGIEFITNADIGKNVDVNELRANFDALSLCLGATKPRDLNVPGRELNGVHFAMVSRLYWPSMYSLTTATSFSPATLTIYLPRNF